MNIEADTSLPLIMGRTLWADNLASTEADFYEDLLQAKPKHPIYEAFSTGEEAGPRLPKVSDSALIVYVATTSSERPIPRTPIFFPTEFESSEHKPLWSVYLDELPPTAPYQGWLDNASIKKTQDSETIGRRLTVVFSTSDETFEDGVENTFSTNLLSFVKTHGSDAMEAISNLILSENVKGEVASEALRWLGRVHDPKTYLERRWLLERSLFSSSPKTRDGAALGLASLDDPHAVPYVERAIEGEGVEPLRADMKQVLDQLVKADQCHLF